MDTLEDPKTTLAKLLRNEIDCASALLQFMQAEGAKLASTESGLVTTDSDAKLKLIDGLQRATQERLRFMQEHNLSATLPKPDALGFASESDAVLNALFAQLSELARQCYDQNRLIGQLINRRAQFVTQILASLSPVSRNSYGMTYAENGNTSTDPRNGLLDLARI
jgi:flagellar biosynthesis/type III secretory pathway chaperone